MRPLVILGVTCFQLSVREKREPFSPNIGHKYLKEEFDWYSLDHSLPLGLGGAESVIGSSHLNFMVAFGEKPSPKRKGRSGCLGMTYFGLLNLYALALYQTSLPLSIGGTEEPCSLCWPVISIRFLLVASPLDDSH